MSRKIVFTVLIILVLLFAMTSTVFSSVTTVSESGGQTVKISGVLQTGAANIPVAIDVFAPGKGYADLETVLGNNENTKTVLAHRYEVKVRKTGCLSTV